MAQSVAAADTLATPFATIFPAKLLAADIHLFPLESHQIEPLTTLPFHHRDPFDRLIAATALVEGLTLVSADTVFDAYGIEWGHPLSSERKARLALNTP